MKNKKNDSSESEAPENQNKDDGAHVYELEDETENDLKETRSVDTENNVYDLEEATVVDHPVGDMKAEEKIRELEAALKKEKNDALYARAEFENYKRRAIKERSDLVKYGGERLLSDILTVLDNFERAIEAGEKASDEVLKKVSL